MIDDTQSDANRLVAGKLSASNQTAHIPSPRVCGLLSLLFAPALWFAPRRVGAYFAATSWRAAVVAHVFAVVYAVGTTIYLNVPIGNPGSYSGAFGSASPWELDWLRGPVCSFIIAIHGQPSLLLVLAAFEGALLLIALLITPFAAFGERALFIYGRSVRAVFWSTTVLPAAAGLCVVCHYMHIIELTDIDEPVMAGVLGAVVVWWFLVLIRSGLRPVSKHDASSLESDEPRCVTCGYVIAMLPVAGDCPECGRAIADSLPERRRLPFFARAESSTQRFRSFFRTMYAAVSHPQFFQQLACRKGHARAVQYLTWLCGLNSLISPPAAVLIWVAQIDSNEPSRPGDWYVALLLNALWFVLLHLLAGLAALIVSIFGRRPLRQSAVVTCYAMSVITPLTMLAVFVAWALASTIKYTLGWTEHVLLIVVATAGVTGLVVGVWKIPPYLRRAYRDTRFANA